MQKSIYSEDYKTFLSLLRLVRDEADLTQGDLAARLQQTQSFISKCERGERRLDVIELRQFCQAIGITLTAFVEKLENTL